MIPLHFKTETLSKDGTAYTQVSNAMIQNTDDNADSSSIRINVCTRRVQLSATRSSLCFALTIILHHSVCTLWLSQELVQGYIALP